MAEKNTKDLVFGKGIGVAAGFDLGAQKPLDSRATVATIADRDAHVTNNRAYPGMLVYVCEDEKTYQYTYNTDGNLIWVEFGFNSDKLHAEVVDNLESDDATKILSAKQGKVLKGLIDAEAGRADAAEKLNAAAAKAAQNDVDALEGYVGTFTHETAKTVIEYIDAKTDGIATSSDLETLAGRVTQAEKDIDAIEADYLKAADKEELANSIKTITDDYLKASDKQELSKAISDEKDRAMAAEKVNADAIALLNNNAETAGSVDYKIAQAVAGIMGNPDETMNSINELVTWVNDHAEDALELSNQVSANKNDIATLKGTGEGSVAKAIADAIDKADLEQYALASELDTAEGKISALEGKVDVAKVSEAISNAIKAQDFSGFTTDAEHTELAGKVTTAEGKIAALEAKFGDGEGSVADMVADAKQEAIDAAAKDAKSKADAAQAAAIAEATRLDGLMDSRVDAIEAVVNTHALKSEVEAIDTRLTKATGDNATEIKNIKNSMGEMSKQIADKAEQSALNAATDRITTLEQSDATHNTLLEDLRTDVNAAATKEEHNALKALVGTTSVDSQIDAKITALDLAKTYEAKGEAAKEAGVVNKALEAYKGTNDAAVAKVAEDLGKEATRATAKENELAGSIAENAQDIVDLTTVVSGKVDNTTFSTFQGTVGNTYETKADATAKLTEAKGHTNTEVAKVQGAVDDLEELVGELPADAGVETVVAYIEKRTSGIATSDNLAQLSNRVKTIEDDYLKAADKTALSNSITAEKERAMGVEGGLNTRLAAVEADYLKAADKTELQGKIDAKVAQSDYDAKVQALEGADTRIEGLVTAEAAKAREEEGKLDARLVEVESFFKLAEGETLDTALDTLVEIQKYLDGEGSAADQMVLDIAANKGAIDKLNGAVTEEGSVAKSINDAIVGLDLANTYEPKGAEARAKAYADGLAGNYEVAGAAAKALKDAQDYADGLDQAMDSRVDAIEAKLKDVEANADVNIIETVKVNGVALKPDANKAVDVTVPTGALASKDKVAEADLESALATKLNGKVDSISAGAGLKATREGNAITIDLDSDFVEFIFDCGDSTSR